MARRAASISRAVMRARLVAFKPNSPNATELPRRAKPPLRPLNCLRYLVRFGCSIVVSPAASARGRLLGGGCRTRRHRPCPRRGTGCRNGGALGARAGRTRFGRLLDLRLLEDLALEDPHLHADDPIR